MVLAAVGQLCATACIKSNLIQCQTLVRQAAHAGAKVLFLPEASDYIATSAEESLALAQSSDCSHFLSALMDDAKDKGLHINVGVHEVASDRRLKNSLLWIDDKGCITQSYQKIHLFDVNIKDGPILKESKNVEPGQKIVLPFETPVGRVGLAICFDLRFPEIGLALRRQNAEVITYPSAFTVPTGKAHWESLLRARAIETQSYVVAAAQGGPHNEKRRSYGHSMVVNPWGEIVGELGDEYAEPQLLTADIDLDHVSKIRKEMPLLRRTDVYPEI
ncbi:Benzonitrilase [Penicillium ucsense]|uniref:Benzonitrilase n=1 Tax=Penicillium ucsense TaxID=2839758 RepID=A0A8J8W7Z7_9EURO|nr:Benzonitrilase [Penicillium ucsense]KAF7738389.1 Benzonitrilase [Penicillium ucsense]